MPPGVLHHVMARGIERQPIFRDDADRADLVQRLARLVEAQPVSVYAWALMPNHFHMRPGIVQKSNALALMRSVGLAV